MSRGRVETAFPPRYKKARRPVRRLVKAVLAAEGAGGSVMVALVSEDEIKGLNSRFRGLDEPTDVLSFRQADGDTEWPDPTSGRRDELGEVVACPEVVRRYAGEEGGDPETQMGWTLLHGVLHLLGYDHEQDTGQMRALESTLMGGLDAQVRAVSRAMEG